MIGTVQVAGSRSASSSSACTAGSSRASSRCSSARSSGSRTARCSRCSVSPRRRAFFVVAGARSSTRRSTPPRPGARGVPVRLLEPAFLVVLGLAVAATAQITGVLLVFALLVAPAAAAQQLTARVWLGLALTAAIGLAVTWLALALAYYTDYPVGFFVTSLGFAAYVAASSGGALMLAQEFIRNALSPGRRSRSPRARSATSSSCARRCSPETR